MTKLPAHQRTIWQQDRRAAQRRLQDGPPPSAVYLSDHPLDAGMLRVRLLRQGQTVDDVPEQWPMQRHDVDLVWRPTQWHCYADGTRTERRVIRALKRPHPLGADEVDRLDAAISAIDSADPAGQSAA